LRPDAEFLIEWGCALVAGPRTKPINKKKSNIISPLSKYSTTEPSRRALTPRDLCHHLTATALVLRKKGSQSYEGQSSVAKFQENPFLQASAAF